MKINAPKIHREKLGQGTLRQQMEDLGNALSEMQFQDNTINFVFVSGDYSNFEKKCRHSVFWLTK